MCPFCIDGWTVRGISVAAVVFNVAVRTPECAFQTQMHGFPFSVQRALELLGFRVNISSYVVDIAQTVFQSAASIYTTTSRAALSFHTA